MHIFESISTPTPLLRMDIMWQREVAESIRDMHARLERLEQGAADVHLNAADAHLAAAETVIQKDGQDQETTAQQQQEITNVQQQQEITNVQQQETTAQQQQETTAQQQQETPAMQAVEQQPNTLSVSDDDALAEW